MKQKFGFSIYILSFVQLGVVVQLSDNMIMLNDGESLGRKFKTL